MINQNKSTSLRFEIYENIFLIMKNLLHWYLKNCYRHRRTFVKIYCFELFFFLISANKVLHYDKKTFFNFNLKIETLILLILILF